MQPLDGAVALVTGAARGQGRSHALHLAAAGACVVAVDIAQSIDTIDYPLGTSDDLEETVAAVTDRGGSAIGIVADVRSQTQMDEAVHAAVSSFGGLDIVIANAGIVSYGPSWELTDDQWSDVIDVDLGGVWRTVRAAIPLMRKQGRGGSIIMTSSTAGLRGVPNIAHYVAAKHGVVGLMRTLALELAPDNIRVNTVHPTAVATPMLDNMPSLKLFCPDIAEPTIEDAAPRMQAINALPVPWLEPSAISQAIVWLVSDQARYITGATLPIDAGASAK